MPGTRRTKASSPRYAFKTERELTDTEREKFNKLAIDMKAENPRCGNSLYGTLSFDRRLCAFKCVYITSYGEDDDYMVIYYTLDRKSGEIKSHYHGEEELKLKVSPALELFWNPLKLHGRFHCGNIFLHLAKFFWKHDTMVQGVSRLQNLPVVLVKHAATVIEFILCLRIYSNFKVTRGPLRTNASASPFFTGIRAFTKGRSSRAAKSRHA